MTYKVVYSTITGNTKILATAIKETLSKKFCTYFGEVSESKNDKADVIFIGFCVHEGSCTDDIKQYLKTLKDENIAIFGTAGFGGSESYNKTILDTVKTYISESNNILGSFMCQGKMTKNVSENYISTLKTEPGNTEITDMINNYHNALSHPDENDIIAVQFFANKIFSQIL
ncbi:hypothetical protein BZARG_1415 [Bizionia argentinensis JUB59]|uniref:Flavodoxin-like domain-containing protein n=1 Tax=Bizionia argentinensis JUB59 TaxID=1046627 RepID=G2EBZ1_9FLAO|nr:flavodoxin family protein BilS [Bizionia argentinensis]EGV44015.1 hypothetical protein BZARG_1415 [Bizionia argentinensis JUB59]